MPTKKTTAVADKNGWAGSADEWKRRAGPHDLVCPSGFQVRIRLLGLATLARLDGLSEELQEAVFLHLANHDRGGLAAVIGDEMIDAARGDEKAKERTAGLTRQLGLLTRRMVVEALVEPALTMDDLDDVPEQDLEFLMRVVSGREAYDAVGRRIGVEPLDLWRPFSDEHKCAEGCEACARARAAISTVHVGDL